MKKLKSLVLLFSLFGLLPSNSSLAGQQEVQPAAPSVKKKFLFDFYEKVKTADLNQQNRKKGIEGQPVDVNGHFLNKFNSLTLTAGANSTPSDLIIAVIGALSNHYQQLNSSKGSGTNRVLDKDGLSFYIPVALPTNATNLSEGYIKLEGKQPVNEKVSLIHVLVGKSNMDYAKESLKEINKSEWSTGRVVVAILGGAAVIGAAGGAIYYALQPKAPVKKEPKEEQNEEKLETAPKKTEVA